MCVSAIVNGSNVTYEMKSLNQLGWMAIGFGAQMAGTPMVIMWRNADGSVTVSQREATGLVEPVPVVSPARRATLSRLSGPNSSPENSPILAFDIPSDGANATQSLIWAFGITIPGADPASNIEQHLDAGTFTLNLTKTLDNVPDSSSTQTRPDGRSTSASASADPTIRPIPSSQQPSPPPAAPSHTNRLLVAHAVVSAVGFLVLLPLSALIGRWARTFTPRWFSAHWFITVVLGIPAVCIGWALGPLAVTQEGKAHAVTAHQVRAFTSAICYHN
ncbi:hypothetical protein ACG7TL_002628 [Trametes sanguinea]